MSGSDTDERGNERWRALAIAAAGGGTAMGLLLAELVPLLRRYCASQLARYGRGDWAEDMVQEIMLTVHLKLHTYDDAMPFLAWLYAVAKHKMIDALRRERIHHVPLEEAADVVDGGGEAPLAQRDLTQLLAQLKPPAGAIIQALKVEGASVKALAAQYGMSESNIKIVVHRGLRRLAEMMAKERA
jgi:RNA polymerase sigma-70 factor (ECF subfamily)